MTLNYKAIKALTILINNCENENNKKKINSFTININ